MLQAYAVISTGVRLTVTHVTSGGAKSTVLATNARGLTLADNIADVFGAKCCALLQPFSLQIGDALVDGFLSRPMHGTGRSAGDRQFFYINRRPVDLPRFARVANEAYRLLNKKQFPMLFLNVALPTDAYDVNVTPNKREIMLHTERELLDALKTALDAIFQPNEMSMVVESAKSGKKRRAKDDDEEEEEEDEEEQEGQEEDAEVDSDFGSQKPRRQSSGEGSQSTALPVLRVPSPPVQRASSSSSTSKRGGGGAPSMSALDDLLEAAEFPEPVSSSAKRRRQLVRRESAPASTRAEPVSPPSSPFVASTAAAAAVAVDDHACDHEEPPEQPQRLVYVSDDADFDGAPTAGDAAAGVIGSDVSVKVDVGDLLARFKKRHAVRDVPAATPAAAAVADDGQVRFFSKIAADSDAECTRELERVFRKSFFAQMQIVGQFNLGFIIARLGKDVFIVDQHATDEKFNYERLAASTVLQTQALIAPRRLELTPQEEDVVIDNLAVFQLSGFQFKIDGDAAPRERVKLVGRPFSKATEFGVPDIQEMIFMLSERPGEPCRPSRVGAMLAMRACRSSVMIGTALTQASMQNIVQRMADMAAPWSCPHGRPTMRHLFDRARLPVPPALRRDSASTSNPNNKTQR